MGEEELKAYRRNGPGSPPHEKTVLIAVWTKQFLSECERQVLKVSVLEKQLLF